MKTERILNMLILTLIISTGIVFNGCSSENPVTNQTDNLDSQNIQFVKIDENSSSLAKTLKPVKQKLTWEDGGEIVYEYFNNKTGVVVTISFKVLPETIIQDTTIYMELQDNYLDIVFGPHGLTFSKPALLSIEASNVDLSQADLNSLGLYYVTPQTQWEKMGYTDLIVKPESGYIKITDVEIPHFSRYAIAWAR